MADFSFCPIDTEQEFYEKNINISINQVNCFEQASNKNTEQIEKNIEIKPKLNRSTSPIIIPKFITKTPIFTEIDHRKIIQMNKILSNNIIDVSPLKLLKPLPPEYWIDNKKIISNDKKINSSESNSHHQEIILKAGSNHPKKLVIVDKQAQHISSFKIDKPELFNLDNTKNITEINLIRETSPIPNRVISLKIHKNNYLKINFINVSQNQEISKIRLNKQNNRNRSSNSRPKIQMSENDCITKMNLNRESSPSFYEAIQIKIVQSDSIDLNRDNKSKNTSFSKIKINDENNKSKSPKSSIKFYW